MTAASAVSGTARTGASGAKALFSKASGSKSVEAMTFATLAGMPVMMVWVCMIVSHDC